MCSRATIPVTHSCGWLVYYSLPFCDLTVALELLYRLGGIILLLGKPNYTEVPCFLLPSSTGSLHPSLRTYALSSLHREGDIVEDGTPSLCVFHCKASDIQLATVGPVVTCMGVVDDDIRASATSFRFP